MYLLESDVYEETKNIKCGKLGKSALLQELSDWFAEQFNVNVLNFRFDTLQFSKRKKFRLDIIVDDQKDYEKMVVDDEQKSARTEDLIAQKFRALALQHGFPINKRIRNIFVVFSDFSREARTEANEKTARGFRRQIRSAFPRVWDVYGVFDSLIVFYYTGSDVVESQNNGISEAIQNLYYEALKRYDEMNYFTRGNLDITFDSKENLDKNFEGNLYNYIH